MYRPRGREVVIFRPATLVLSYVGVFLISGTLKVPLYNLGREVVCGFVRPEEW